MISPAAAEAIEAADELRISPMVRLELQYLFEIGRVGQSASVVVDELRATIGVIVCDAAFPEVARRAERLDFTRDPFDRLIVAQAALMDSPLVTRDETIHGAYGRAVW